MKRVRSGANRRRRAAESDGWLVADNAREYFVSNEPSNIVAIDCEFVGARTGGYYNLLARVSIVNGYGDVVYDEFVAPTEPVTDYRTAVSGVRPRDLLNAISFHEARMEVCRLIRGRIVVGHAVHNDFRVLNLNHSRQLTRDTAKCSILKSMSNHHCGAPSLKMLAKKVLGIQIQRGEHDSITDARVALQLYNVVKGQWEAEISRNWR